MHLEFLIFNFAFLTKLSTQKAKRKHNKEQSRSGCVSAFTSFIFSLKRWDDKARKLKKKKEISIQKPCKNNKNPNCMEVSGANGESGYIFIQRNCRSITNNLFGWFNWINPSIYKTFFWSFWKCGMVRNYNTRGRNLAPANSTRCESKSCYFQNCFLT